MRGFTTIRDVGGNVFGVKRAIDEGYFPWPRNPYPSKLGVIEEGAYADLLLINGNPLEDIAILTKPEENLALIMKDGVIF